MEDNEKVTSESTKLLTVNNRFGQLKFLLTKNKLLKISESKLNINTIYSLSEFGNLNSFLTQIGLSWINEDFPYPELIITKNVINGILNEGIKDKYEVVLYYLKEKNLFNEITPKLFYEKVVQNPVINSSSKISTVCKILKNAKEPIELLNHIEEPMFKLLSDEKFQDVWNKYVGTDFKIDMNLNKYKLEKEWYNKEIVYDGELILPNNTEIITNFSELKIHYINASNSLLSDDGIIDYWNKMLKRNIFMLVLKTGKKLLIPIEKDSNDCLFSLGKVIKSENSEIPEHYYYELNKYLIRSNNQTFFKENYKVKSSEYFVGKAAIQAIIDLL